MTARRALIVFAAVLPLAACVQPPPGCPARIVVDVGHTPDAPGTTSASGVPELVFNRRFADGLTDALRDRFPHGTTVQMVEVTEPDPLLDRRVADIAAARPGLVLSVHHDSVQERYLTRRVVDGRELSHVDSITGFSLFVPTGGEPGAAAGLAAARAIADGLLAAGERPSLHHAEPIEGENRRLLDPGRGIYAGDFLKILRTAPAPAVLIEVGVIKNPAEERRLSDATVIALLADAVADAVFERACAVTSRQAARTSGSRWWRSPTG